MYVAIITTKVLILMHLIFRGPELGLQSAFGRESESLQGQTPHFLTLLSSSLELQDDFAAGSNSTLEHYSEATGGEVT